MKIPPMALFLGLLIQLPTFAQTPASSEELAFFEQKIRPVLIDQCHSCHSQSAKKVRGGLLLDSREAILKGGDSGPAAISGDPAKSLLIRAVHYKDTDMQMPPKGKLTDNQIILLEQWVRRGIAYPAATVAGKASKKIDIEAGRQFWSFKPLRNHEPPKTRRSDWPSQRIDSFVLAELEKRNITPAAPASKRDLLRRAKLDLIGMPPTPVEIEAFEKSTDPGAYAKWIDQWLASPHYGERWARHWLDLTRYCDIGEEWTETKGSPHHYRDWAVRAVNEDIAYDRFVRLQLAADLMADARPTDRAALGFIGLSPTYWKELQLPVEIIKSIVSDEYEERIHTLSGTLLGLNIACARCHDHKFAPITTEDYYALAGVFASSKQADQALVSGAAGDEIVKARDQVSKLEAELKALATKKEKEPAKALEIQAKITKLKATPGYDAPLTPGLRDASLRVLPAVGTHGSRVVYEEKPQDMAVEIRGNPNKPGAVVPRRFVSVLSKGEPVKFSKGSGRLELADALVRESGALMARVFVNRVWRQHFGIGIVDTPSDFGRQGEEPSHPELLDDLAARFVANGWSLKWLHREIMLSATYRQASGPAPAGDGNLKYYSRFPGRRLDVEAWRDSLLFVCGNLDLAIGGPASPLHDAANHRRTLYGTVKRRELSDLLRLYDFPDPVTHSPNRIPTITPLQQLFTLNSPLMASQSVALLKRLDKEAGADPAARINRAYALLYGRSPSPEQRELGLGFVKPGGDVVWGQYLQVLLGSNEFMFVE